ncbi:collagen-binding domain-containing protein [Rhodovulum sulfidophilum]|uniref:collagen-binding domain-containing protein n=1 Tax=Rhodovulum sulfidophilum TaxID=35806 RepID=UPI001924A1F8|nr:collagen-binding domain-containing protein [Rhodovulum sulfidophilum]MBL3560671.1 choice-of-anchor A family protein [Rhodovulum sulfidophilum]
MKTEFLLGAALAVSLGAAAPAATLSASEILSQFSIVTAGDLDTNQDNYGRAYVGGNLETSGKADFVNRDMPVSAYPDVIVEGNARGPGSIRVGSGGTTLAVRGDVSVDTVQFGVERTGEVLVGGTLSESTRQNINNKETPTFDGVRVESGLAGDAGFEALFPTDMVDTLNRASEDLSALAATGTATVSGGNTLNIDATSGGLNVYNFDISDFGGAIGQIDFSLGATDTLILNVSGSSILFEDNLLGLQAADGQRIIWNFYEATAVDIDRMVYGTVLAGNAALTNSTAIEGNVFAASAVLRGQVHLQPFAGELPPTDPAPVPLPATLPMLAAGLGLVGLMRRRRS